MGRFEHLEMGDWQPERPEGGPEQPGVFDENYYLSKADEAFADEDYERALAFYSRTLQYEINTEAAWLGQLRCLIELNELPEAVIWSNRALERFPKSGQILAARAVAECRIGRVEAAMGYLDSAFAAQGVSEYAWLARGEVLIASNLNNARACFFKAIELAPRDWKIRAWIGRAYLLRKRYHQALEHFREAARLDPNRHMCWYWVGQCSEELGQREDARIAYQRALAAKPSFTKAQEAFKELGSGGGFGGVLKRLFSRG